ncbi:hypothetical protein [Methylobacterium indicum]|uniref:hypothetical protein n=1 Tax=Methylobacterium indicum TaxID=1775910 RepID=UPI002435BBBC|nr:hypothetical protein [Methylobacterium indicum]
MGRKRTHCVDGRAFGRLERVVTTLVEAGLQDPAASPPNLIERLRHLQRTAMAAGGDRQILQVIASGRRLLGDGQALTGPGVPTDPETVQAPSTGAPLQDAAISPDGPHAERPASSAGTTAANEPTR